MTSLAGSRLRSVVAFAVLALFVSLISGVVSPAADAVGEGSGGVFVPVTPTRIADTFTGINTSATPIPAGGTRAFNVLGVGGVPSTGVGAVVLDVADKSTGNAAVAAYADGTTRTNSFLRIDGNDGFDSNTIIVKPGSNGKVAFYNSEGNTDLNVDVQGYFTVTSGEGSPGGFVPVTPSRMVASNYGVGLPNATLKGGTTSQVQIGGMGDIPADAMAIFANVRVYSANDDGGMKLLASNDTATSAYAINFVADDYNDTGMSIKLGPDGKIKIVVSGSSSMTLHVIVDVQGYFSADPDEGGSYTPLTDARFFDSRDTAKIPANGTIEVPVAGLAGVPDDGTVGAVAMTVSAFNWTATGTARVYDPDTGPTATTNIGFTMPYERAASSTSIVAISDEGTVAIENLSNGAVDIVLDAQGWFARAAEVAVFGEIGSLEVGDTVSPAQLADAGIDVDDLVDGATISTADPELPGDPTQSQELATPGEAIEPSDPGVLDSDLAEVDPTDPDDPNFLTGPELLEDPVSAPEGNPGGGASTSSISGGYDQVEILRRYHRTKSPRAGYYTIRRGSFTSWIDRNGDRQKPYGWEKAYVKHNVTLKMIKRTLKAGWYLESSQRFEVIAYKWKCYGFVCYVKEAQTIRAVYSNNIKPSRYGDYFAQGLITAYCPKGGGSQWCPNWIKKAATKY